MKIPGTVAHHSTLVKVCRAALVLVLCFPAMVFGHVGSPGVSFEGSAGPYPIMALINPPEVIPGTATVDIFTSASNINAVLAKPVYWFAGGDGTPQADEMLPVPGEPGHYRGVIWLMDVGTSGIAVEIKGSAGTGTVMIPVMAVSVTQKKMGASLGWPLAALGVLLVVLMVTIISVSVSDGLLRPNDPTVSAIRRKRRVGAIVGTVLLLAMLWGGKSWWDGWAKNYENFMFKPIRAVTRIETEGANRTLVFAVDTAKLTNLRFTRNISYIIPDHGKLMHMFLVKANTLDVFAHLHPKRRDSVTFVAPLPPLPPGQYLVFADVTRVSGFSETIPDTLVIPEQQAVAVALRDSVLADPDNTYFFTNAIDARKTTTRLPANEVICGKPGVRVPLGEALTVTWQHNPAEPLLSRSLYSLKFDVQDTSGRPAALEPYLGMMGHAVVMKDDGSVYIHLHPVGSYSMASQQTMLKRFATEHGPVNVAKMPSSKIFRDSVDREVMRLEAMTEAERNTLFTTGMQHKGDTTHAGHTVVSFPYSFPSPGNYRIWIQMKHGGKILNSAFDATVE